MYEPRPPRRIPPASGRSVLETAVVAVGTTCLFVAATTLALAAAVARDDPRLALAIAATVWIGATVGGVLGARRIARVLGSALDRRQAAARARGR